MKKNIKFINSRYIKKDLRSYIASISILLLALLLIAPAAGATDWEISPSNPEVGDTLKISGTAAPNAELTAKISFEKTASVSSGKYEYEIDKVKIPSGENNYFTVRAEKVQGLDVNVKKFGVTIIHLGDDASGGVATVSQGHVPSGTYGVLIIGNAQGGESKVNIKITAQQTIEADSEGDFEYSYDTDTLPPGDFDITIGGKTETITLAKKGTVVKPEPEPVFTPAPVPTTVPEDLNETEALENVSEALSGEFEPGNDTLDIVPRSSTSNTSEESAADSETPKEPTLDGSYLLIGLVAGLLINAIYLKRR